MLPIGRGQLLGQSSVENLAQEGGYSEEQTIANTSAQNPCPLFFLIIRPWFGLEECYKLNCVFPKDTLKY
jgi:hypothetical protein